MKTSEPTKSPRELPSIKTFASILLLALSCCTAKAAPSPSALKAPPLHVETASATRGRVPRITQLTGTLFGERESDLAANTTGRVLTTSVERGMEVVEGAVLVTLDVRTAILGAREAQASTANATAQLESARLECARARGLFDRGAITKQELERALIQCETTEHAAAAAEARSQVATKSVADGRVRAPFAGVIADRYVHAGEYVHEDTRIVTLVDARTLRLEMPVPEAIAPRLVPGTKLRFRVAAHGDHRFDATVKWVGAAVRRATRDVIIEAIVDNAGRKLLPGMFAAVDLATGESDAVTVPQSAVVSRDGTPRAFVLVDGEVQERVLELASEPPLPAAQDGGPRSAEASVAVLRGIANGERVVRSPSPTLKNGDHAE